MASSAAHDEAATAATGATAAAPTAGTVGGGQPLQPWQLGPPPATPAGPAPVGNFCRRALTFADADDHKLDAEVDAADAGSDAAAVQAINPPLSDLLGLVQPQGPQPLPQPQAQDQQVQQVQQPEQAQQDHQDDQDRFQDFQDDIGSSSRPSTTYEVGSIIDSDAEDAGHAQTRAGHAQHVGQQEEQRLAAQAAQHVGQQQQPSTPPLSAAELPAQQPEAEQPEQPLGQRERLSERLRVLGTYRDLRGIPWVPPNPPPGQPIAWSAGLPIPDGIRPWVPPLTTLESVADSLEQSLARSAESPDSMTAFHGSDILTDSSVAGESSPQPQDSQQADEAIARADAADADAVPDTVADTAPAVANNAANIDEAPTEIADEDMLLRAAELIEARRWAAEADSLDGMEDPAEPLGKRARLSCSATLELPSQSATASHSASAAADEPDEAACSLEHAGSQEPASLPASSGSSALAQAPTVEPAEASVEPVAVETAVSSSESSETTSSEFSLRIVMANNRRNFPFLER